MPDLSYSQIQVVTPVLQCLRLQHNPWHIFIPCQLAWTQLRSNIELFPVGAMGEPPTLFGERI